MDVRSQHALAQVLKKGSQFVKDYPNNLWTLGLVETRLDLVESYWNDFKHNHVALLNNLEGEDLEDPYFEEDAYHDADSDYAATRDLLIDIHSKLSPGPSSSDQPTTSSVIHSGQTRLPRISVPPFNGDRQQWESFKDLFQSLIHSEPSLKDVDKLYYLKTLVSGEALSAIQSIPITAANYALAWSTLEARYDNIYLLVQSHLLSLKRIRPIKEESPAEIQKLSDDLRRHRDQLLALKRPVTQWDDWFVSIAADAMDRTTRRDWEEELQRLSPGNDVSSLPTFQQLETFLQRRCRTLKSLDLSRGRTLSGPSRPSDQSSGASSKRAMFAATTTLKCELCEQSHYIGHCEKFQKMNPDERRKEATLRRLCFNCLRSNHLSSACPSTQTCRTCKRTHHSLLHNSSGKRFETRNANAEVPHKKPRQSLNYSPEQIDGHSS